MEGPAGYSNAGFVGSQVPWQYTIYFENTSNAQAYARQVSIADVLDPSLDIRTFRVGNIVLGNVTITVPTNQHVFSDPHCDATAQPAQRGGGHYGRALMCNTARCSGR